MNVVKESAADPALRKELADPYSLCPAASAPKVRQPNVRSAQFDLDFGAWVAPFVMSAINTRIVLRTNALSEQAYGAAFTYDEAMLMGRGFEGMLGAAAMTAGLAGFMLAGEIVVFSVMTAVVASLVVVPVLRATLIPMRPIAIDRVGDTTRQRDQRGAGSG